jgi:hypothetical protein
VLTSPPFFDKRKNRWTVIEPLGPHNVQHHRFHDEDKAKAFWAVLHPDQPIKEDTVSDDTTDVQHLGALGLDVTPLALSDRAIDFFERQIDGLLQAGVLNEEDHALGDKLLGELRIARDATVSKREDGRVREVAEAQGVSEEEASAQIAEYRETEAQRIAGKMAKASRDAVEGESE